MDIARPSRKKELQRRRVLYIAAGVIGLIAIAFGINSLEPAPPNVERSSVWIESVKRGEFLRSVHGPGTLVPEEIRHIAAETNGLVEQVLVDAGAEVTADTVILRLSNPEVERSAQDAKLALLGAEAELADLKVRLESQLLDQKANLARVKADYESGLLEVEANRELATNGLIPNITLKQSELASEQLTVRHEIELERLDKTAESMKAQLEVKKATVSQQRALFELRQAQLDSLQVRATINGVLQMVAVEAGQRVVPGSDLARVARPDRLKAEIRINETQAKDVLIGQLAHIDTRNGIAEGRVKRIDPAVQQGSVIVDVEIVGALPDGARPDLSVDGTIELERLEDVLYTGRPAYGQPNSTISLFKLEAGGEYATMVPVTLGRSSVGTIEIVSGLNEGDQVILSDNKQFDEANRIRLR